jgi:hypothetical protein
MGALFAGDGHKVHNEASSTVQHRGPLQAICSIRDRSASAEGSEATRMYGAALAALMRWPRVDSTVCPAPVHNNSNNNKSNDDDSDIYVVACALDFLLTSSTLNCRHQSASIRDQRHPSEESHGQSVSSSQRAERMGYSLPQHNGMHAEHRHSHFNWESEGCIYSQSQHKDTCGEWTTSRRSYMHACGTSRTMHACAALRRSRNRGWASSRLFAIGGRDTTWRGVACTASYDAVNDEWQYGPSLPNSMQYVRAVGLGEALFVFGNMLHPLQMHVDWDWRKGKWRSVPAEGGIAWRQLQYMEAVAVDSEVWNLGGRCMPNNVRICHSCCLSC